jgi:hypothetical protein
MTIINTFNMKQAQKHFLKTERRHHPRYSVLEFECTVFCQGIQNPNRLINIGLGGLSFQVLSRMPGWKSRQILRRLIFCASDLTGSIWPGSIAG